MRKLTRFGGLLFAILSLLLYILFDNIEAIIPNLADNSTWWGKLLLAQKENILEFCKTAIYAGFAWFVLLQISEEVWSKGFKPTIEKGFEDLSSSVNSGILGVRKDQITGAIIETMNPSEAAGILKPVLSKVYGEHANDKNSLADFFLTKYFTYLRGESIYKDCGQRDITVTATDKGYCWTEYDSYTIKYVNYDKKVGGEDKAFHLPYIASFRVPSNETRKDFLKSMVSTIKVDEVTVFDIQDYIDGEGNVKPTKSDELSIRDVGAEIIVQLNKRVNITKEETKVRFHESSHHDPEDCCFSLINYEPMHDFRFSLSLPDNWVINSPLISRSKLDGRNRKAERWEYQSSVNDGKNKVSIHINDWMLPGIILSCSWMKKE